MLSFIVPAYNEELELPATIVAIQKAARYSGHDFELIVADDASTDRTAEIAEQLGARVVSLRRRQIAAARNAGATAARGEVLFFVDADTRIGPQHISAALEALNNGSAGGSARIKLDGELARSTKILLAVFSAFYFSARLGAGAFLFTTRKNFVYAGGFDEQYFAGEEVYLSIALKRFGPFKILRDPVLSSGRKLRMHPPYQILTKLLTLIFGGPQALRRREKLSLWYDGKREQRAI